MAYPQTIVLKGDLGTRYEEGRAAGTIKPGHLIKQNSSQNYVVHATAGGGGERLVAIEDGLIGKTIDDNYVSGDLVRFKIVQPGDVLYMLLKDGQSVVPDDILSSNGDGTLRKETSTGVVLFKSLETVAPSGADGRIRVRAI
jgi:hypothetical protein